ncbi:MAG: MGMT family protein [Opitutae bacterium]|nr:MGMT family protein [Opitutae bacterium]
MLKTLDSPFGQFHLQVTGCSIVAAYFDHSGFSSSLGCPVRANSLMKKILAYCSGFSLSPHGTAFQTKTWNCISKTKPGDILSYNEVSIRMGKPGYARAVASAIAQNPIAYLIPCHRIIRSNGHPGGYRWNPLRKKTMLDFEKLNFDE